MMLTDHNKALREFETAATEAKVAILTGATLSRQMKLFRIHSLSARAFSQSDKNQAHPNQSANGPHAKKSALKVHVPASRFG